MLKRISLTLFINFIQYFYGRGLPTFSQEPVFTISPHWAGIHFIYLETISRCSHHGVTHCTLTRNPQQSCSNNRFSGGCSKRAGILEGFSFLSILCLFSVIKCWCLILSNIHLMLRWLRWMIFRCVTIISVCTKNIW